MSAALTAMLKRRGACEDAVLWAKDYATLPEAWAACPRGDWMLWLAAKAKLCSRQELVLAACECARLSLVHVRKGELRPLKAIETAEAWARGEVPLEDVRSAAAYAADAAADAAAAAAADARSKTLATCADIVRRRAQAGAWLKVSA